MNTQTPVRTIHLADGSPVEMLLEHCGDAGPRVVVDAGGDVLFDLDVTQVDHVLASLAVLRSQMAGSSS